MSTGRLATKEEEEEVEEDLDENPDQLDIEPDLPYALPPSWCLPIVISPQQFESRSPDGRKGKKTSDNILPNKRKLNVPNVLGILKILYLQKFSNPLQKSKN